MELPMEEREPHELLDAAVAAKMPEENTTVTVEEGVDMTLLDGAGADENDGKRVEEQRDAGDGDDESVASDGTLDLEAVEEEEPEEIPFDEPAIEEVEEKAGAMEESAAEAQRAPASPRKGEEIVAADKSVPTTTADASSSSSSSSSNSSSSSSSSSDSSSDSEVEDVTEQYASTAPAPVEKVDSDEDEEAEQWFQQHDLEVDGMEVVAVVRRESLEDAAEDDVDVFLLPDDPPQKPTSTAFDQLERGSATKRPRAENEDAVVSDGLEMLSSSDPEQSENEFGRRKAGRPRKKKVATGRPAKVKSGATVKYNSVPRQFSIFENIAPDDSEFPVLKGEYKLALGGHRAYFSGLWGFTEADFAQGVTSKFEYSSGYIHGRGENDQRPFSGKYGGYFNLRQFNGKIVKVKEETIEFHFIRLVGEEMEEEGRETKYEVVGDGKNRYGRFLVRGYYNAADGRMRVRRRYLE